MLRRTVEVRVRHLDRARDERLERLLGGGDAGDGQRAHGGAVVGDVAADRLVLHGFSDGLEVLPSQLPRRLDRLAAAGGEEDAVEVAWRVVREALGQRSRLRMGVGPQREERELAGLLARSLRELDPAVADLDHEKP